MTGRRRSTVTAAVLGFAVLAVLAAVLALVVRRPAERVGIASPATTSGSQMTQADRSVASSDPSGPTSSPPGLLEAYDTDIVLDFGQFWIATGSIADLDPMVPLNRAIEGDGIGQEGPLTTVLSPHQHNSEMPLRVELWSATPPDDAAEWPEAFELHFDVGEAGLYIDSPTFSGVRVPVPAGSYRALITGRGFVGRGWTPSATPGDDWRIQLWPSDEPLTPRRLRAWPG